MTRLRIVPATAEHLRALATGVTTAIAHTRPEPNFSTRVLTTLGFTQTSTVRDPDEGDGWRWALPIMG